MATDTKTLTLQIQELETLNRSYQRAIAQLNEQVKGLEVDLAHASNEVVKLKDLVERLEIDISFYRGGKG